MNSHESHHLLTDEEKEQVLVEVVERVLDSCGKDPRAIELAVFDTLYDERRRLENANRRRSARQQAAQYYDKIHSQALDANDETLRRFLKELVQRFACEVAGHFDPRVYALATRVVPTGLSILLNALSPIKLVRALSNGLEGLEDRLDLLGEVEALQQAAKRGTVVLVPTHSSNLDSVLVGFALYRMGLPPFLYGAGLNLFENRLIGFFMHNLGAYKVDRRKTARVYKEVLKTYAGCTMELGYHNIFFPGGTRSRSGSVEQKLKLGLLGMALEAYVRNLLSKKERPDVFVVPCTINYQLVLEAETLIDDHLKAVGKSRYIIEDDEFSKPRRVLDFVQKLFSLDARIQVVVSRPMDVFGNQLDDLGQSLDFRGRLVDRRRYVMRDEVPLFDNQRDMEYTRELAGAVAESFRRDTIINPTNVVSKMVFGWLEERSHNMDLYRLLRTGGPDESLPVSEACERLETLLKSLRVLAEQGRVRLDPTLMDNDASRVLNQALAYLGTYHTHPALQRRGDRLFHLDRNLLLYYQNRLNNLPLNH